MRLHGPTPVAFGLRALWRASRRPPTRQWAALRHRLCVRRVGGSPAFDEMEVVVLPRMEVAAEVLQPRSAELAEAARGDPQEPKQLPPAAQIGRGAVGAHEREGVVEDAHPEVDGGD